MPTGSAQHRRIHLHAALLAYGLGIVSPVPCNAVAVDASAGGRASSPAERKEGAAQFLRHAYTVFFVLRACTELGAERRDTSFAPSVSMDEARRALKTMDAAAISVGIDADGLWASAAPIGVVTAEALKSNPQDNPTACRQVGGIFRSDVANLQNLFRLLGSRDVLIPKDF